MERWARSTSWRRTTVRDPERLHSAPRRFPAPALAAAPVTSPGQYAGEPSVYGLNADEGVVDRSRAAVSKSGSRSSRMELLTLPIWKASTLTTLPSALLT